MRFVNFIFRVVGGILLLAILIAGYLLVTEWKPAQVETIYESPEPFECNVPQTITVLSWNIGYAGLDQKMDFFYDGGTQTRTSREQTQQNLDSITSFIARTNADFVLLQEVDFKSLRSYNIDQFSHLQQALPEYRGVMARNYVSSFVPMPLTDPMGWVDAGLVTLSRLPMAKAVRYQYPSEFPLPMRLFNLKRAVLVCEFLLPNSVTLYVNNTHNTAYDTGGMRTEELKALGQLLIDKPASITAGDWNGNPPGYTPSQRELADPYFNPTPVGLEPFPTGFHFAADLSCPSNRYLYEPYRAGTTATSILDFALLGAKVELVDVRTVDLGFSNSDHNPVIYRIKIK